MVLLLSSRILRAEGDKDDQYEDLIFTSMRSIVSLDELVTELSVQVAKLTTSLSMMKVDGKEIRKELQDAKTKISYLEFALDDKVGKLRSGLSSLQENVGEIREDVTLTKTKFADLEENGIPVLRTEIDKLATSVADTNAKVDEIDEEVALVSGEEEAGSSKCIKVCAGTTGRRTTKWINQSSGNGVYTDVDIGSCGFVKTPTVTTALEGSSGHWLADGTSAVYDTSPTKFRIYISKVSLQVDQATSWRYNVEWISVGYTC